ncbi:hypothetical protein D877_gp39 [Edwardsiella phage KF-1]|uniref:Uncharacterized protein n=1 Tax=Edwardsiella phage KF-1 TaxID=1244856 RepID=K4PXD9_9CAUD|nr:hypothetical protein D877_gp39 [Edwardsiella phage KF-1]BAM63087.1 hypothetical protein [Edwardsiella phage KF-1]
MNNAYIGAGIAAGAADIEMRSARVKEARSRAEASEIQLQRMKQEAPLVEQRQDAEMAQLRQAAYTANAQLAKQQSFDAFQRYQQDMDPKHLNQWVQNARGNPVASGLMDGISRFDRVSRTPEVERMLQQSGVKDIDGFFSDPKLASSLVVATGNDGSQQLVDMNKIYAMTGYAQYATDEQMKSIMKNSALLQQIRAGGNMQQIKRDDMLVSKAAELTGMSRDEAYRMLHEAPKAVGGSGGGAGSALERVASQLRKDDPDMDYRTSLEQAMGLISGGSAGGKTNEGRFIADYMQRNPEATREDALSAYRKAGKDERTSAIKNTEYAEEAQVALDDAFGGDFLGANLASLDPTQTRELNKYVNRIEQVGGLELSPEEKRNARAVRKLVSAGSKAGKLTDEQTGLLDSTLNSTMAYISDNVEHKEASIAMEQVRALTRNALFGSQVSNSDYAATNKLVANLGQKTGPVLASLKNTLETVRDDMQAAADLGDQYVAKARYGRSLEDMDKTINAIDARIRLINKTASGGARTESGIKVNPVPSSTAPSQAPGSRPSLDEIFNRGAN